MHKENSASPLLTETQSAWLMLSIVDSAGVVRAKSVPLERLDFATRIGIRTPDWAFFTIDNAIATNSPLLPIGEHWLKPDLNALKQLDTHLYWAPAEIFLKTGEHAFWCARNVLRQQCARLKSFNMEAKAAGELEFTLLSEEACQHNQWQAYGMSPLLDNEAFITDVIQHFARLGLEIEQFHAEHAQQQFELSMAPAAPMEAMDKIVLARIELSRIARKHHSRISFSPKPFLNSAGNGAHLHFSFFQNGAPLLADDSGTGEKMSPIGGNIIGGIVHYLPEMLGLLAPSILSALRLQPGLWSGAYACWGVENKEAAVRYCEADKGYPANDHVEIKCIDASANPYVACAAVLAMALQGIQEKVPLPSCINIAPDSLSEQERIQKKVVRLNADQHLSIDQLGNSTLAGSLLPSEWQEALIAVRQHEIEAYGHLSNEEIIHLLRFAWSI